MIEQLPLLRISRAEVSAVVGDIGLQDVKGNGMGHVRPEVVAIWTNGPLNVDGNPGKGVSTSADSAEAGLAFEIEEVERSVFGRPFGSKESGPHMVSLDSTRCDDSRTGEISLSFWMPKRVGRRHTRPMRL